MTSLSFSSLRILAMTTLVVLQTSCTRTYDLADGIGKEIPTVSEPCYNWQCITDGGKKKSDVIKSAVQQQKW